jgi:HK97 family phage major capsid protein
MELNERITIMKEERMKVVADQRAIYDLSGDAFDQKREELGNLEKRADQLAKDIMGAEKLLETTRSMGEKPVSAQPESRDDAQMKAFGRFIRSQDAGPEYRAFTQAAPTQAGYLVAPMKFVNELIKDVDDDVYMRRLSKNMAPGGIGPFQSLGFPKRTTAASDADWKTETAILSEESTLAFGRREFKANRLGKFALVSKLLLSTSNAESIIKGEISYKLGVTQEKAYLTGDGVGKPLGIFTASVDGISTSRDTAGSNSATAIAADTILDVVYGLKSQYLPGSGWMAHRDFYKAVAKLKTGEGQYLWQPSTIAGQPDTLKGFPIYMSEYAPNTFTTGLYVAVFGNFGRGYGYADSLQLEIQPLWELYALYSEQGYAWTYYGDGAPILEEAFVRVKMG